MTMDQLLLEYRLIRSSERYASPIYSVDGA